MASTSSSLEPWFLSRSTRLLAGALLGIMIASARRRRRRSSSSSSTHRRARRHRKHHSCGHVDHSTSPDQPPCATICRPGVVRGVEGLIGNTPLMRIESLSELTGCEILGKCEFLNPAGSPKDRVALQILLDAEAACLLTPHAGDCVFEGTVGSTGISLATLCRAKGYRCSIVLPDDVASEKSQLLEKLGAEVKKVRPRGIVDKRHFVNEARALASAFGENEVEEESGSTTHTAGAEDTFHNPTSPRPPRGFFADQFETSSNFSAHYHGTGPEIWAQCGGSTLEEMASKPKPKDEIAVPQLDAFVAGAGTGGTLSGVAAAIREREDALHRTFTETQMQSSSIIRTSVSLLQRLIRWSPVGRQSVVKPGLPLPRDPTRIVLADPQGSGLFNKVKHGVLYSPTEAEGTRRRHQVDTIVEGIGMNRITNNLSFGIQMVDDAIKVQDEEAVRMSRWLSVRDGLFLGSSSAVNLVASVKTAMKIKHEWRQRGNEKRPTVVTILCDSGARHLSKFHNDELLARDYHIVLPQDSMQINISDLLKVGG